MPMSRRIFLRAGAILALGTAASSKFSPVAFGQKSHHNGVAVPGYRVPNASMDDPLTFFSKSTFSAQLNSKFRLRKGESTAVVTLTAIDDLAPAAAPMKGTVVGSRECFSLVFSGAYLPQDTYTVEHAALGTFTLFLVPAGKRSSVPRLEAIINRLHS